MGIRDGLYLSAPLEEKAGEGMMTGTASKALCSINTKHKPGRERGVFVLVKV